MGGPVGRESGCWHFMGGQWWVHPSAQCAADMSVLGAAAAAGDSRLIQTYSSAGSPDGSVRTRSVKLSVLALVEN